MESEIDRQTPEVLHLSETPELNLKIVQKHTQNRHEKTAEILEVTENQRPEEN